MLDSIASCSLQNVLILLQRSKNAVASPAGYSFVSNVEVWWIGARTWLVESRNYRNSGVVFVRICERLDDGVGPLDVARIVLPLGVRDAMT
jgi:hypothetical protein